MGRHMNLSGPLKHHKKVVFSSRWFHLKLKRRKNLNRNMNKTLILILTLSLLTVEAVPIFQFNSSPNPAVKQHGKTKFATGVGLWTLGALTGNTNLQQTGQALAGLGLVTKGLAHLG